jgi:hypothetical protein
MIINIPSEGFLERVVAEQEEKQVDCDVEIPPRQRRYLVVEERVGDALDTTQSKSSWKWWKDCDVGKITGMLLYRRTLPEFHYENANIGYGQRFTNDPWDTVLTLWGHGGFDSSSLDKSIEESIRFLKEKGLL